MAEIAKQELGEKPGEEVIEVAEESVPLSEQSYHPNVIIEDSSDENEKSDNSFIESKSWKDDEEEEEKNE